MHTLKYKTDYINTLSYSEIGQMNPIRWEVAHKLPDGTYEVVSKIFKCKDFLNEVVASYHTKKDLSVYGFKTSYSIMALEGIEALPLVLSNVTEEFHHNLEIINKYLTEINFPILSVEATADKKWLLNLPMKYMESTYYMSHITLYIRCASIKKKCHNMDDLIASQTHTDQVYLNQAIKLKPIHWFKDNQKEYVSQYASHGWKKLFKDVQSTDGHYIHDCGFINWDVKA